MRSKQKVFHTMLFKAPGVEELCWCNLADDISLKRPFLNALTNLPKDVKTLDLSADQLGLCDMEFLMSIPDAIKVQIPQLNLSFNQFSKMNFQQLLDFFSKIQLPITHLDFSNNHLYDYSLEQNFKLLTALPKSLQSIDMTNTIKEDRSMLGALQEKLRQAGSKLSINFHLRVNE